MALVKEFHQVLEMGWWRCSERGWGTICACWSLFDEKIPVYYIMVGNCIRIAAFLLTRIVHRVGFEPTSKALIGAKW
jgi:hypothetical protein